MSPLTSRWVDDESMTGRGAVHVAADEPVGGVDQEIIAALRCNSGAPGRSVFPQIELLRDRVSGTPASPWGWPHVSRGANRRVSEETIFPAGAKNGDGRRGYGRGRGFVLFRPMGGGRIYDLKRKKFTFPRHKVLRLSGGTSPLYAIFCGLGYSWEGEKTKWAKKPKKYSGRSYYANGGHQIAEATSGPFVGATRNGRYCTVGAKM